VGPVVVGASVVGAGEGPVEGAALVGSTVGVAAGGVVELVGAGEGPVEGAALVGSAVGVAAGGIVELVGVPVGEVPCVT